jgi:hypothetical protein
MSFVEIHESRLTQLRVELGQTPAAPTDRVEQRIAKTGRNGVQSAVRRHSR